MLRNLEMLSNAMAQNLLSDEGRLNSNFSFGGKNMSEQTDHHSLS